MLRMPKAEQRTREPHESRTGVIRGASGEQMPGDEARRPARLETPEKKAHKVCVQIKKNALKRCKTCLAAPKRHAEAPCSRKKTN